MPTLLLTGAAGFLGRILHAELGAAGPVLTLGRSAGNDLRVDLAKEVPARPIPEGRDDQGFRPDRGGLARDRLQRRRPIGREPRLPHGHHAAGKAHCLPRTAAEAEAFFAVNHRGTLHLLAALERLPAPPRRFVFISTVAVYGRAEGEGIDETHALLGATPYARSKIEAEAAVRTWCEARSVAWFILRLPLVAGPHPPGNLGAMRRAIARGRYFRIAGNRARKSVVLAADVARLIGRLEEQSGAYNLTDGIHPTFAQLEEAIAGALGKRIPLSLPGWLVAGAGKAGDLLTRGGLPFPLTTDRLRKMTGTLTFSDEQARRELGWKPRSVLAFIREGGLG